MQFPDRSLIADQAQGIAERNSNRDRIAENLLNLLRIITKFGWIFFEYA